MHTRPPPPSAENKFDGMTKQDIKKIEKSMRKPEFMGLLNQYMVEISDPKNKDEYDQYLRQMERQKQLPKHMKLVELKPQFCFRTMIVSQKNKKHEMKFFVNLCSTEYLEKPSCEPQQGEDGKVGYSWKIPNSMSKLRYDQDRKGQPCQAVDVAFHTDTFRFAAKKQFQEMIISIALQASQRQLGERKQTLSRDYSVLQNVKCWGKDGKPALLPIRYIKGKVYNKGQGPTQEQQRGMEGKETKLQKQLNKQKQDHQKSKKEKEKEQQVDQEEIQEIEEKKLIIEMDKGLQRPKYKTIFSYPVDYAEFMQGPSGLKSYKVPSAFNIQFQIPRVESMDQVAGQKLEINDKKIILGIGQKYFIDLELEQFKLKYALLTANAKAKYDKKKKSLRIVIPIDQTLKYEPEKVQEQQKVVQEEKSNEIVQDETWKNKVLDFQQPDVSVKLLEPSSSSEPQKPKLIQQIDEDDEIDEPKQEKVDGSDGIQKYKAKEIFNQFSIDNYRKKEVNQQTKLNYLFQQTNDKIVLVVQIKNYQKQHIKMIYDEKEKNNFFICYNKNNSQPQDPKKVAFLHLQLQEQFVSFVDKIEILQRVGFVSFVINKCKEQKGKYWQKTSINKVQYSSEGEEYLNETTRLMKQYQSRNADYKIYLQKQEQIIQIAKQKQKLLIQQSKPQPIQKEKEIKQKQQVKKTIQKPAQNIFKLVQPQCIIFSSPFAERLD